MTKAIEIELKTPFKLFEDCFITKGFKRGIIVDMTHSSFCSIPNDLCDLLIKYNGYTIQHVIDAFDDKKNKKILLEYFHFLIYNNFIFFTLNPNLFPKIDVSIWKQPSKIYQAIIDISFNTDFFGVKLFKSLDNLNVKYLQIRVYEYISVECLKNILSQTENTSIIGIEIFLKYKSRREVMKIISSIEINQRINSVIFFNAPKNETLKKRDKKSAFSVNLINQNIIGCVNCGLVSQNYFSINVKSYIKANNANSCLSGKISIDINGDIKNCPSMKESYGNLKNTTIESAINKTNFEKYWNIKKDEINVCKDCEFRYICTDCRAYIEDPNDIYSKPLKCGYSPYTNIWENWSLSSLKDKAIKYYELEGTIIDRNNFLES
jgi:SPASM domain peptide maturase of grasp-with-spasm system